MGGADRGRSGGRREWGDRRMQLVGERRRQIQGDPLRQGRDCRCAGGLLVGFAAPLHQGLRQPSVRYGHQTPRLEGGGKGDVLGSALRRDAARLVGAVIGSQRVPCELKLHQRTAIQHVLGHAGPVLERDRHVPRIGQRRLARLGDGAEHRVIQALHQFTKGPGSFTGELPTGEGDETNLCLHREADTRQVA